MNATRQRAAAFLAFIALLAAGCQRGDAPSAAGPSAENSTSSSTSTSAAPKNLVTPQTAGHPVLEVKLGEPVIFQKDGIMLTFTPKSLTKLDGTPADLDESFDRSEDCGVWWQLTEVITVDAQPNATWKLWSTSFSGFNVFQKGEHGNKYSPMPVGSSPAGGPSHPNDVQAITLAEADQQKNPSAPFHRVIEAKDYAGACTDIRSRQPSGLDPLGVDLSLDGIRDGETSTKIARWLL
ncbi:hypothetical protein Srot_0798 [Segniliparus rotundus DSM 44985]|uniref:Lipoprotein n=1 Tax=Segniliparus rotundus (strain ATCC BAA-972 / CDC 1076 / CIP 108378 / DSM 44985 / JCM 13578) TaxID=640132 RepID=D6ZDZ7_SEGRD|nr:hypothetical protein [Segniliparus rotundus]ADG97277.1 hypothetical protein Srot_0798 [Segniliparus rotundus DSM 44985]